MKCTVHREYLLPSGDRLTAGVSVGEMPLWRIFRGITKQRLIKNVDN